MNTRKVLSSISPIFQGLIGLVEYSEGWHLYPVRMKGLNDCHRILPKNVWAYTRYLTWSRCVTVALLALEGRYHQNIPVDITQVYNSSWLTNFDVHQRDDCRIFKKLIIISFPYASEVFNHQTVQNILCFVVLFFLWRTFPRWRAVVFLVWVTVWMYHPASLLW